MRLNVFLQRAGVGSRREAERLVAEGRVMVNGVKAEPTTPVEFGDKVLLDGKAVAPEIRPIPRVFLLNKPLDVLVTHRDPQGRPTIYDLPALNPPQWPKGNPRVINVGRLDVNSEGLLVMTSDGPLAQAMMSPAMGLLRVYRVRVFGSLSPQAMEQLAKGVTIEGIHYRGAQFTKEEDKGGRTNTWYRCVLTEGKNREIRKLMEHYGCVVNRLIRVQYGPFKLEELPSGAMKEVPPKQVKALVDDLKKRGAKIEG